MPPVTETSASRRQLRILGAIGRGGFGTVYLAEALSAGFQKQVAVKVANTGALEGAAAARLLDEARLLGLVRHSSIVAVEGLILLDGQPAMVMEYIRGVSLARLAEHGPVPPRVALAIVRELASALHAAWSTPGPDGQPLSLVHRDIKPANILLTAQGEVKLLDFGLARADVGSRNALTSLGVVAGTAEYLAPERTETGGFGPAADIYALGAVLYELIRGEPLGQLRGNPRQFERTLDGRLNLLAARVGVDSPILALVENMLAYKAEARPSAREVRRDCDRLHDAMEGERLLDWAEDLVPQLLDAGDQPTADPRAGRMFSGEPLSLDAPTLLAQQIPIEEPTDLNEVALEEPGVSEGLLSPAPAAPAPAIAEAPAAPRPIRRVLAWVSGMSAVLLALTTLVTQWHALVGALTGAGPGAVADQPALANEPKAVESASATASPPPAAVAPEPSAPAAAAPEPSAPAALPPTTPAPAARAGVSVRGQATQVTFSQGGKVVARAQPGASASLDAGAYVVSASFEDTGLSLFKIGRVDLAPGSRVTITCQEVEHTCSW